MGAIFERDAFTVTADYYSIDLTDRLAVSQDFTLTPEEVAALVASGVTSAANLQSFRFFTNDFDTSTEGVDVVATWALDLLGGRTDLSVAYNHNTTEVTQFNPETLNDTRIRQLEEGLPETRWSLTGNQDWGNWRRSPG